MFFINWNNFNLSERILILILGVKIKFAFFNYRATPSDLITVPVIEKIYQK